ncbi:MAG: NAD-dependent protein deacylase [Deltaproteobacteria bacterium]|nr:NAD-dependent protein deacylase [Deltaproteobacteria bacterium]
MTEAAYDAAAYDDAARLVLTRQPAVVLTGAGISVASGIPDFRSSGGLWERYPLSDYGTIAAFRRDPKQVWTMLWALDGLISKAEPNQAHRALANMERLGLLDAIVTQNIDGLHQKAGSSRVIELHGAPRSLSCLNGCGTWQRQDFPKAAAPEPIDCPVCGAALKPDVTFFGEPIAQGALYAASHLTRYCGVMLVAGTSATVAPASQLPMMALGFGAKMIELNHEVTPLTDHSTVTLCGPLSETLPKLVAAVETLARTKEP